MSIFGFGALQIGCFSTKMQHLLPWAPLLLPVLLHPQLQAPSHPIPSHRIPSPARIALHILFGSGANCSVGPAKGAHVPMFLRLFLSPQKPKILFIMSPGGGRWRFIGRWGAAAMGIWDCHLHVLFRFIKCSPCRMQLPIYFAGECTSGSPRLFMGLPRIRNNPKFSECSHA